MTTDEIKSAVESHGWYHEIDVCEGVQTKPAMRFTESWELIDAGMATMDLMGKRVLDVGTRDGKYAFRAEKMGAEVVAIDSDQSKGALLLKEIFNSKVEFRAQSLYDLSGERFDTILFFGVLYHLRYPINGLKCIADSLKDGGDLYIESGMMDAYNDLPMLYCPVRENPYEVTSCTFFNFKGLRETLWSLGVTVLNGACSCPSEDGKLVRRMWMHARKTHDIPANLNAYWNSKHSSHD